MNKEKKMTIRFKENEYDKLVEFAKGQNKPVSTYCRDMISLLFLNNDIKQQSLDMAKLDILQFNKSDFKNKGKMDLKKLPKLYVKAKLIYLKLISQHNYYQKNLQMAFDKLNEEIEQETTQIYKSQLKDNEIESFKTYNKMIESYLKLNN